MPNSIDDQIALNLKLSQLALHNKEIVEKAANSVAIINELADELINANKELLYWGGRGVNVLLSW